jgi:hypothetical protein
MRNKINPATPLPDSARREAARLRVLDALRRDGAMARAALGRATGLSPASISAVTGTLVGDGVLIETQDDITADALPGGRGRPGIRLGFNATIGAVIGAWVGLNRIVFRLADLTGRILVMREHDVSLAHLNGEALVLSLAKAIKDFISRDGAGTRILGIGLAMQGSVDARVGRLVWSPVLAARDIAIAERLRDLCASHWTDGLHHAGGWCRARHPERWADFARPAQCQQ